MNPGFRDQVSEETSPHLLLGVQDKTAGCGAKSASLLAGRALFWQLSRDGNLHGSGMLRATTASPKSFFTAPWRTDDAVVARGNAGWTTPKNGHPCPRQNCSQRPPAEEKKSGRGSLLNRPSCFPDDRVGHETELNSRPKQWI